MSRQNLYFYRCVRWIGNGYAIVAFSFISSCPASLSLDAVGTIIADRPPHRTVRARLRIRLPPWMSGGEAYRWIRMQNAR
jgi:hypothetical protein